MSAQVTIVQLPAAGPITGTESVPIVQNGQTVQTTTGAIAASPSQNQTFLTINSEATLPNSRYLSTSTGLGLTDGGALSFYRIALNRAAGSLETALTGIVAKDTPSTVVARTLQASGSGLSVSDGNGVSGNPTFSLTGQVASLANASGAGLVALPNNGSVVARTITGTASEIDVADGTGAAGNPTIGLADNPVLPGTGGVRLPTGTTAERTSINGYLRYNSELGIFEGYANGAWVTVFVPPGGGVTSVNASGGTTGMSFSGGPITSTGILTLAGTLGVANGGTGATTLTANNVLLGNGTSALQAVAPGTAGNVLTSNGTTWASSALAAVSTISFGTTGLTPSTATSGAVTVAGTLAVANGGTGVTTSTGTGSTVLSTSPTFVTPILGTPTSVTLTNGTGLPIGTGVSGLGTGVATALAVNVGSAGAPVVNGGALGTPSSGTLTNATGLPLTTGVTGTLPVGNGGTGATTLTANNVLLGNGTSAVQVVAPGTAGNVLTSNGTTWQSTTPAAGGVSTISFGTTGLTPSTATSGAVSVAGTLAVANGGTGVTTSSGANSVVLRDASNNITANAYFNGFTGVTASASPITLTVASTPVYSVTGSGGQTIQLPNATTLQNGTIFSFNNGQSSGAITVNNNSGTLVVSVPSGGYVTVVLLSNASAAGSWDRHDQTPANVSWSTNTLDYPGSITNATWNGTTVAIARGGTGQTTASAALSALGGVNTGKSIAMSMIFGF